MTPLQHYDLHIYPLVARKAGLPDDGDYGRGVEITQPTSDAHSWTWSRTANTKDVSNKILTNQTNLTSTLYTGSIGHDVSTGVEFTRETQTGHRVNPVTLPAVNIYHPDSSIHPGGLYAQRCKRQWSDGYLRNFTPSIRCK